MTSGRGVVGAPCKGFASHGGRGVSTQRDAVECEPRAAASSAAHREMWGDVGRCGEMQPRVPLTAQKHLQRAGASTAQEHLQRRAQSLPRCASLTETCVSPQASRTCE